jgi:hypothetical protein
LIGFSYKTYCAPTDEGRYRVWGYKLWAVLAFTNIKHLWCNFLIAPEVLNIGKTSSKPFWLAPAGRNIFYKKTQYLANFMGCLKINLLAIKS